MHALKKDKIKKLLNRFFIFLLCKNRQYHRVIPLSEYFNDRDKKAQFLQWGSGSTCYDSVYIYGDVSVGRNTFVGPFCILDGSGGLVIGDNCSISAGVHIYTHDSVKWAVTNGQSVYEYASVEIESGCYIGPNVVIAKGVKIGKGSIVGACSFVNRDVPAYSKVYGIPASIYPVNNVRGGAICSQKVGGGL